MNGNIKTETTPSGSGYMDDDFYEDTGELSMPQKGSAKDVWVTRIPKWLYDAACNWDDLAEGNKDDDQIVIGEVMAMSDETRQGGLSKTKPMRFFLNENWQKRKQLPQAFELQLADQKDYHLGNAYVFTEKDLPGYKPTGFGGFGGYGGYGGYGQNRQGSSANSGVQDPKARVYKRSKYKKAIPKQTNLIGPATREYNANPLNTPEFTEFQKKRTMQAIQGKELRTNIMDTMHDHTASQDVQKMFNSFIKSTAKPKGQHNKAARIPKNELIDMLHNCFDRYAYWGMRVLKAETHQPEAYLKEVLADIGDLIKTGPFASCYRRKPMYNRNAGVEGQAPETDIPSSDEEMENVV